MKLFKFFLIFSFTQLFAIKVIGQPIVDIPLSATNGTYSISLAVGFDPIATSGIDPQFGESDLPPFPSEALQILLKLIYPTTSLN